MKKPSLIQISLISLSVLTVGGFSMTGLLYLENKKIESLNHGLLLQATFREKALVKKIATIREQHALKIKSLSEELNLSHDKQRKLKDDLKKEQEKVDEIENEYNRINGTVSDLLKLGNTDDELLQKYSKVYFLNENYSPSKLKSIDGKYLYSNKSLKIHAKVWPFLKEMLQDAQDDGVNLRIISAYRSFAYQQQIKQTYVTIYGSGANQFSADQGYSEHQLGTTVDFTTPENGSSLSLFEDSDEFKWLERHAYKYGFVLSYPDGNDYYQYEPWHWRFVGTDLADDLHDDEKYFYDLDQRKIDEYLLEIFD